MKKKKLFSMSLRSLKLFRRLMVLLLVLSPLGLPVQAQTCATIQNINISDMQTDANGNTFFKCNVEVDSASAGSGNVACGIRNSEKSFPQDFCPSGVGTAGNYFGGWNGNIATFRCVVPKGDTIARPNLNPEIVGYDFQNDICGPDKGKAIPLTGITYVEKEAPQVPTSNTEAGRQIPNTIHGLIDYFYQMRQQFTNGSNSFQQNVVGNTQEINSSILNWSNQITRGLVQKNGYYDRLTTEVKNGAYSAFTGGKYWCTQLVIDALNLAGIKGLNSSQHLGVINMMAFWKQAPAPYEYVDYEGQNPITALQQVQPGCAVFFARSTTHTGNEHVAIVKTLDLDNNQNGWMETYEANAPEISYKHAIKSGVVQNTLYPLRGFGCVANTETIAVNNEIISNDLKLPIGKFTGTQDEKNSLNFIKTCKPPIEAKHLVFIGSGQAALTYADFQRVLNVRNSPAKEEGKAMYDMGISYGIDPTFMLAFFMNESTFGTCAGGNSDCLSKRAKSIGNIICTKNWTGRTLENNDHCFRAYDSWTQGAQDWYNLIRDSYINIKGRGLIYAETIIPVYAPPTSNGKFENDTCGYINKVTNVFDTQFRNVN